MANGIRVLFSGRFDPPHPGHIAQIIRLAKQYRHVVVVMLDYPERDYPIDYCLKVFQECLQDWPVEIITNKTHFAKITKEDWESYLCNVYAGGNLQVLRHIEKLGISVTYIERAFNYSASKYERVLASPEK